MMTAPSGGRPRGRPPTTTEGVRLPLVLTLHVGADDDLIAWFAALPKSQRARYVKAALRQGGATLLAEASAQAADIITDDAFEDFLDAL